jgi:hypothetical protein
MSFIDASILTRGGLVPFFRMLRYFASVTVALLLSAVSALSQSYTYEIVIYLEC